MDPYVALAKASHYMTQVHADELETIADKQESNLAQKKKLRDLQKYYDSAMSDDTLTSDEVNKLSSWMEELGVIDAGDNITAGLVADGNGDFQAGNAEEGVERDNKEKIETQIKDSIENAIKDLEDVQSQDQFEIQMATSDLQNSETERRQAFQKMTESRKQGAQVWGQG